MMYRLSILLLAFGCGEDAVAPELTPEKIYTAFDESGGYTAPLAASGATGIAWTSSNDAVASISGNDTLATVTGKSAGTAMITAASGDATTSLTVTVVQYTTADKNAGSGLFTAQGCGAANCHAPGAESDVSPSVLEKHTDAEVTGAILMGLNPEGGDVRFDNHEFPLTTEEQKSMLAYLRSLAPAGPPEIDE
jgi:hypothetical protein